MAATTGIKSKREAAVIKAREIDAQPKAISSLTVYELFIGAQQLKRVSVIEKIFPKKNG